MATATATQQQQQPQRPLPPLPPRGDPARVLALVERRRPFVAAIKTHRSASSAFRGVFVLSRHKNGGAPLSPWMVDVKTRAVGGERLLYKSYTREADAAAAVDAAWYRYSGARPNEGLLKKLGMLKRCGWYRRPGQALPPGVSLEEAEALRPCE